MVRLFKLNVPSAASPRNSYMLTVGRNLYFHPLCAPVHARLAENLPRLDDVALHASPGTPVWENANVK
jgi:hypothetical protein